MDALPPSAAIKSCCSALYGSEAARLVLGDAFHPGGLALTLELAADLRLGPEHVVLDVACGRGESLLALAERSGARAVGVDLAEGNVRAAEAAARERGLATRASFLAGDAERLPFPDRSFDALLSECAFCTFPDKPRAAAEMARVLRPGARLGLSDATLAAGPLPEEFRSLTAWAACIGDARPATAYAELLEAAGFAVLRCESRTAALVDMIDRVQGRLLAAEVFTALGKASLRIADIEGAKALAGAASHAVRDGLLGYVMLVAERRP